MLIIGGLAAVSFVVKEPPGKLTSIVIGILKDLALVMLARRGGGGRR